MYAIIVSVALVVAVIVISRLANRVTRWSKRASYLEELLRGVRPHMEVFGRDKEERFPRYLERSYNGIIGGFDRIHFDRESVFSDYLRGVIWCRINGQLIRSYWSYDVLALDDFDYACKNVKNKIKTLVAEKEYFLEDKTFQEIYVPLLEELHKKRLEIINS